MAHIEGAGRDVCHGATAAEAHHPELDRARDIIVPDVLRQKFQRLVAGDGKAEVFA